MITKTHYQKVVVQTTSSSSLTFKLFVGGTYRTVNDVAKACGAYVPTRRGYGHLDDTHAVWCIHLDDESPWNNKMNPTGDTIIEKKRKEETPAVFQNRVFKGKPYDVNILRLCFVKEKGGYRFVGVYRMAAFDFDNSQVVFKKEPTPVVLVKSTIRKRVTVEIEEEESITNLK